MFLDHFFDITLPKMYKSKDVYGDAIEVFKKAIE